jgi:hypothetical protein
MASHGRRTGLRRLQNHNPYGVAKSDERRIERTVSTTAPNVPITATPMIGSQTGLNTAAELAAGPAVVAVMGVASKSATPAALRPTDVTASAANDRAMRVGASRT